MHLDQTERHFKEHEGIFTPKYRRQVFDVQKVSYPNNCNLLGKSSCALDLR